MTGFDTYSKTSSTYREILFSVPCRIIPLKSGDWRSLAANGSNDIENNNGEREHPCLVPRCNGKYSEYTLFVHTEATGEVYNSLIHEIKSVGKPNCLRCKKGIPTLVYQTPVQHREILLLLVHLG